MDDHSAIAVGDDDSNVFIINFDSGTDFETTAAQTLTDHTGEITSVKLSNDGTYLLTTSDDGLAIVYEKVGTDYETIQIIRDSTDEILAGSFTDDFLAIGGVDNTIRVFQFGSLCESGEYWKDG